MVSALRGAALVLLLGVLVAPSIPAQSSLSDRLGDVTFPQVLVTVGPTQIVVQLNSGAISGQTASDLRRCMDNHTSCPDNSLRLAGSAGNKNSQVETGEIQNFETLILFGLGTAGGQIGEFRNALRALVKIDGKTASAVRFEGLTFQNAGGAITSTTTISVFMRVALPFSGTGSGTSHRVEVQRAESDIEFAQRIAVRGAAGWEIAKSSIQPSSMQAYYADGAIAGSQQQFQSSEPLAFDIRKVDEGTPAWVWWTTGSLGLLAAAGGGGYWWFRRTKV